jgi:hypothetical protein
MTNLPENLPDDGAWMRGSSPRMTESREQMVLNFPRLGGDSRRDGASARIDRLAG